MPQSYRNYDEKRRYSQQRHGEHRSSPSRSSSHSSAQTRGFQNSNQNLTGAQNNSTANKRRNGTSVQNSKRRTAVRFAKPAKMPKVHTIEKKTKRKLPVTVIIAALIFTVLLMFMIVSFVQINEYTVEISKLKSQVNEYTKESQDLTLKLEEKNSLSSIEDYSTGNLGMVSGDRLKKEYISNENGDKIETYDISELEGDNLSTALSSFFNNFRGIHDYYFGNNN